MADIANLQESWNGHSFPEVEGFIKDELSSSGKKVELETQGSRFRVNLLDSSGTVLSSSNYVSTTLSNSLSFKYTEAVLNVKLGDKVYSSFFYEVMDSNGDDAQVPASVTLVIKFGTTIKGSITKSVTSNSTTSIDITDYIESGSTTLEATVTTDNGEFTQTIYGRVNAINLVLSSSFNPKQRFTIGNNLSIPYSLVATSGTKIVEWFVDLSEAATGSYTTTSNSASPTISIPTNSLASGTHTVLIRAKYNNGGTYIYSNSICFFVALASDTSTERLTGFASRFDYDDGIIFGPSDTIYVDAGQYSLFTLSYFINDSDSGTVNLYVEEDVASTGDSNSDLQYTTKLSEAGDTNVYIFTDRTLVYQFIIRVESAGVQIEEPANAVVLLRALNKSNARSDRNTWEYNGTNYATFENFNWTSDGWQTDSLLIRGKAKLTLDIKPLERPTEYTPDMAMTIIFKIKVATVLDLDAAIISCLASGYGITITPQLASMITSTGNTVSRLFASGYEYEIGFVSYPADGGDNDKMLYLYINGIVTAGIRRSDASVETIYQPTGTAITISGEYADVYLYSVSFYKRALSANEMVDLYLLNINDTTTFIDEYNNNNVIDDGGSVTVNSIPDNIPYLILTGQSADSLGTASTVRVAMRGLTSKPLPRYDIDEILFVNKQLPSKNFKIVNGCIRLQGTTTLIYPVKNLRIYSKNSKKLKAQLYLGVDASGQGGTLSTTHKYSFKDASETASGYLAAPVSCFVLKADCSDSSSTHNVGFATFINKVFIDSGVKTPALKLQSANKYDIRVSVDGFPCYVFYRETNDENPTFLGKFNMINDKGSGEVFGFEEIKGLNNKSDGFRNVGEFKMIRVTKDDAQEACAELFERGSWESLKAYAVQEFTTTYSNGALFNNGNSEYDSSGEFIEYDDNGNHIYWDRYGFVYEDDSYAAFYDCNLDAETQTAVWTLDDGTDGSTCHKHINPTESWEFATNLSNITNADGSTSTTVDTSTSSRVLFTTSEFDNMKDGVAEWTNDFDLRYPDDDDLLEEYQSGAKKPRYLKACCDWLAGIGDLRTMTNAEIKAAKFKNELSNYFDKTNLLAYFCAVQLAMGVDQMAKNLMLCFFYDKDATENDIMGKMRGYMQFYDNDTILGLRNDGYLIYNWDLDFDTWDSDQNLYAFAGYKSVLWGNLVYCFSDDIKAMYLTLRENFTLQDFLDTFTKQIADKYCERIVNIDMYNKYIEPLIQEGKSYLMSLHGTRTSHRTWLITNRVDLFDARYFAGDYKNTIMMLRGGRTELDNTGNVKIVTQRDWYYAVEHESTISEIKFIETGGTYSFSNRMTVNQSLSPQLYGLKYAKSLDLSDFIWNISQSKFEGTYDYLQELIYSNYSDDHDFNSDGSYCNVGEHAPILKRFVACHQRKWGTLDISENNFIEEVDVRDSDGVTSINFPTGDSLTTLRLGPGLTTLTLTNKPNVTTATIEGASNFNNQIIIKDVSNVCSKMGLLLLNKRYAGTYQSLLKVELEMGTEDDPISLGQTNINDLISLANDTTITEKLVSGYAVVDEETIYRYLYNLLSEKFPNLHITCTASPDQYRIASENAEISECNSTNIYPVGMDISVLRFEIGKVVDNVFTAELDTPAYSGSVRIDATYPLADRISIDSAGKFTCDVPHENSAWTLDVYVHAYPYYYTDTEKANDTYINSKDHYVKVTVKAVPVTGVTITGLGEYISPNTIYKPTYMVTPSNNTKSSQGVPTWSSNDVLNIDATSGLFTSPTSGTIVIQLKYSMFGKNDGDSVKSTSVEAILNSAIMDKTTNSDVFYAFRTGLANARTAGVFTAFDVYETDELSQTGAIVHNETQLFTATELQDITSVPFTYVLKELAKINTSYSFSFGNYLVNVKTLTISDPACYFGPGLVDFTMPIESIQYTCTSANLFKDCVNVQSLELPYLRSINIGSSGVVTNEIFKNCGSYAESCSFSLPILLTIQMTSTDSQGVINEMFYGTSVTSITLPVLTTLACGTNDIYTERMFGGNQNLNTVSLPNLVLYRVGASATFDMFYNSGNITTLSIGNVGANNNSTLTLEGFTDILNYITSNLTNLTTFNTKNVIQIPGVKTFYNDNKLCQDTHTLDWGNTKLQKITYGAQSFFYRCEQLRKWILPSTINECAETSGANDAFLFGSYVQLIDIRNRTSSTAWGDLFKGKVTTNTDTTILNPVQLLFLHIPTSNSPTVSSFGTGLAGNYPVFIGTDGETNTFSAYSNIESTGSFRSIYDPASYLSIFLNYSNYVTAINNGREESLAYNMYPCTWERGVTKNRLFPYCMAKWMSRKIFMTSLDNDSSGVDWATLNEEINAEINPTYNANDPSTLIEYDLDDITGTMLHNHKFDTKYSDKAVITTYGTTALMRILLDTGVLAQQFPGYTISYSADSGEWNIVDTSSNILTALEITRSQLTNSTIYNNATVRLILDAARNTKYGDFTFDELLYFTNVTQINAGTLSDLNGNIMTITSITFPQNCTSIQAYGLCNTKLTKVNNIYSVGTLGSYALAKNTYMSSYSLYLNSIESTGTSENIFDGTSLAELKFDLLSEIGANALIGLTATSFINNATLTEFSSPLLGCTIEDFQMPNCLAVNSQIFSACTTLKKVNLGISGTLDTTRLNTIFTEGNLGTIEEYTFNNISEIGNYTFHNNDVIKYFYGNSLVTIGLLAFYNSGSHAFTGLNKENEIYSETITSIGDNAFAGISSTVTKVTLPECSTLGSTPFLYDELTEVTLGITDTYDSTLRDKIFTSDLQGTITTYHFPKLTVIGLEAFNDNFIVTIIDAPNLTEIGNYGLNNTKLLSSIQFSKITTLGKNSLQSSNFTSEQIIFPELILVGDYCFGAMSNITTITEDNFPKLATLSNGCFLGCSKLTEVNLPNVTTIGGSCFQSCSKLSNIVLGITEIPTSAFSLCSALTSLTQENLPNVNKICTNAFYACGSLTLIDLGKVGETMTLLSSCFNNTRATCKIIIRSNTNNDFTGTLGQLTTTLEQVKPFFVSDQYETEYEDALDAYYSRELTDYPSTEEVEPVNSDSLISAQVNTASIESNFYDASDGGDDKIYTYYYPYNAKDRDITYEITQGSDYFDLEVMSNRSLLVKPKDSYTANKQVGKVRITVTGTSVSNEIEFDIPFYNIVIEDSVVRRLLIEAYDSNNDGRLSKSEIINVTSICNLSDERITTVDLSEFTGLTTIPDGTFDSNINMTTCILPSSVNTIGKAFTNCSDKLEITITSTPYISSLGIYPEAIYVEDVSAQTLLSSIDYLLETEQSDTLEDEDGYSLRFDDGSSIKI